MRHGRGFAIRERERLVHGDHQVGRGGVASVLDARASGAEREQRSERARALETLALRRRARGADDEPLGHVDLDERLAAPHRHVERTDEARQRAHEAARTGGLEARLERALFLRALTQHAIGHDERLDLFGEPAHVGRALGARPQLVPRHDEQRRPTQSVIRADATHDLEARALDALRVDEHHVGVERARTLEARALRVGDGDGGLAGAQLLSERVGARWVAVDHQHAQPLEDPHVDLGLALAVDERDGAARPLVELVHERLGARDERRELAHELFDGGSHGSSRAEHDAERLALAILSRRRLHAEDAVAKLATHELHEVVERRLAQRLGVRRALAQIGHDGGDLHRHGVSARDARDHRDRAVTERANARVEGLGWPEHGHGHGGRDRVSRQEIERALSATVRRIAHQEDEIGRRHLHGVAQLPHRLFDEQAVPIEGHAQRSIERLAAPDEQHRRSILGGRGHCGSWSPIRGDPDKEVGGGDRPTSPVAASLTVRPRA